MITKQEFTEVIKELVSIKKAEDNLNLAFKAFEPDFNYICFGRYETLVIKSMELAMNDQYNYISYWIYDLNCGKDSKKGKITDKDGKDIPMKTISHLYDIIEDSNINNNK